jgi:RHS repeat-associated protein
MLLIVSSLLWGGLACQSGTSSEDRQPLRLNATGLRAEGKVDPGAIFDRDTTTGIALDRPLTVTLSFAHDVDVQRLKVYAQGPVEATLSGSAPFEVLGGQGWESLNATAPNKARQFTLRLAPQAAGTRVDEVELWGAGLAPAPRDIQALAERSRDSGDLPFENVHVFSAQPDSFTLSPLGLDQGPECAEARVVSPVPLRAVRRAHLVYEAVGLQRPVVLRRSVNGQAAQGGFWLGSSTRQRTLADELNPESLMGTDRITLCLPQAAIQPITVKGLRVVLEMDDGRQPFERETALRFGAALDGDERTAASLAARELELSFARPLSIDEAALVVDVPTVRVSPSSHDGSGWTELGAVELSRGRNVLALGGKFSRGVRLSFSGTARPDVPVANLSEMTVAGSGVGPRIGGPRLVFTYPAMRVQSERLVGERFGERTYLAGWAESPAGTGRVEVDGVPVDTGNGSFGLELTRPKEAAPWVVTVRAHFPDGSELTRVVSFDDDHLEDLRADEAQSGGNVQGDDTRFGHEEQTAWGRLRKEAGGVVTLGERVSLEAPSGAVDEETAIGITRKMPEAVPRLEPGMVNVTAPRNAGYRFSPPGQKFLKPVKVTLPYDPALLPEGMEPEQIQTFYFDRALDQWKPLPRKQVVRATEQVVSETTHFTFMINAVLALPDHPGPTSFNPTSIKDLKAADPSANIEFIDAPDVNAQGTARLGFTLRLPQGRGSYQPGLQLAYDSSSGNSWMGVGWDMAVSSVQVDTRFGAPFYDGSERYMLDGAQLVPIGEDLCVGGGNGQRYAARVEQTFRRIMRCGAGTERHRFEVTDKNGTLFVYGATAQARLSSASDSVGKIGQWMLERVLDANGNLTLYRYVQDRKQTPGTAFDAANGEDFRQIYLHEIYYSGRATREASVGASDFPGTEAGIYLVRLLREADGAALRERPDITTSGRMGFKVVTRYRLGRVQVRLNTPDDQSIIREYRLSYTQGDFGKSRLVKIEQFGVAGVDGGALFHQHGLEYTSALEEDESHFSSAVPWSFQQADDQSMTASEEWALGAHAYVGIGPGPSKSTGSVGLRVGFNHREGETSASLLDLNGDGLLDRVSQRGGQRLAVQLNQGPAQIMSPVAPPWDPRQGGAIPPFLASGVSLGRDSGDSLNAAIQATFSAFSANVGLTQTWSRSSEFMLDADGDRLVDYVGPGGVLFNQQRGAGFCSPERFCFEPSKPVSGTLDFSNLAQSQGAFASDSAVSTAKTVVKRDFHPTDAMLEWTAPYAGTVDVSGVLGWRTPPSSPVDPEHDGVRLRVYNESQLLAEYIKPAAELSPTQIAAPAIEVQAYQRLYFVLSTQAHLPVDAAAWPPIPLEAVEFAPVVQYTACSNCGSVDPGQKDPTGASLFRFDAAADFKIAGEPLTALQTPRKGVLKLTGQFSSTSTADDVRICVQRFAVGQVQSRACHGDDPLFRAYPAAGAHEALTLSLPVEAGDSFVFREETDLSINPASVTWTMRGEMTEVCEPDGGCHAPVDEERNLLRFEAEPYLPLHDHLGLTPLLRPLVIPRDGTLRITSSGLASGPVIFSGRQPDKLLFKHGPGDERTHVMPVRAGEQITFEAHGETSAGDVSWSLDTVLEVSGDGGVQQIPLSAPRRITYEQHPLVKLRRSPFGGGFHGWRYGLWGGKAAEPFDANLFISDSSASFEGDSDRDRFRDAKGKLRDINTEENRRSRLYAPLLPRRQGTRLGDSLPGLYPQPAYVSQDGTAFIAAGLFHGGHKGSVASGPGRTRTVDAALRIGETSRASVATSYSAGISAGPASLALSTGTSSQRMDVLDMNGDGIIDIVVEGEGDADGVRLTHLRDRVLRKAYTPAGRALRESSDLTASVGMGLSSPVPQLSPGGTPKAVEGMFPSGFGVGAGLATTLSATALDLVDINGDGLADQVRRSGNDFVVRLNLGSTFAAREDRLPVGRWNVAGIFDPFLEDLRGGVAPPPGEDDEELTGREDALSVMEKLSNPDVVRRSTTVSLEGNFSLTWGEDFGATANWSSSLSGTQVVLTDLTGDGLPDYVRKSSSEGAFRVKVNRGYGFGPEEVWPVQDWPTDVTRPRFKVNKLVQSSVVELLGLKDGIDTVEATGSHSALPSVGFVVTVPILIGPGTPWLHLSGGADYTPRRVSGFELGLMDIDGDGLADHVLKTEEQVQRFAPTSPRRNGEGVFARLNLMNGGNLLKRVSRPLGGSLQLSYVRLGNTVDMPESRFVLAEVVVNDGSGKSEPGHRMATQYTYEGGRYDRAERDFYGFATVRQHNPDGSQTISTFLNDNFTRKGLLVRQETRDAQGKLFLAKVHQYGRAVPLASPRPECMAYAPFFLSAEDYCAPSFTPLQRTESRFYEGLTSDADSPEMVSAQVMQYDAATGNVTLFEDLGDVANPGDDLHARVAYAHTNRPDLRSLHMLDLPTLVEVRTGRASTTATTLLRLREGEYDARGDLVRHRVRVDAGHVAETDLVWNADGLLERMMGPPNSTGQRYEVRYIYEPYGRALTRQIEDSFGYTSSAEYDLRFGEATRTTDVAGNHMERQYDSFGRLARLWGPYEPTSGPPTIEVQYQVNAWPAWALTRNKAPSEDSSGHPWLDTVVFMDGRSRIIQTKKDGEVGGAVGMTVSGHLAYDVMGRVTARGHPFFSSADKQRFIAGLPLRPTLSEHDILGRVVRTLAPDGAETTLAYGFGIPTGMTVKQLRSTVRDALGNVRVLYRDTADRSTATEEWIQGRKPTTRYDFDPLGQLVRIFDAAGTVTEMAYDLRGRRTSIATPDTGLTELRYDMAGNLVERVDPNMRATGLSIQYAYEFNRLIRIDRPLSDDILFQYGPPGPSVENVASRVVRVVDEAGVETRGYGRLGEMTRTTRTVRPLKPSDRARTFETRLVFDSFGRMLSVTYPDGEHLRYGYDAGGLLRTATGHRPGSRHAPAEVQVYLSSILYDEFGQRTAMEFGNGVKTTYRYDPANRRLSQLTTHTPRGRTIQALTYQYDKVGNMLGLVNALGQPVGRRAGAVSYEFSYDSLYRLTSAKGMALARPGLVDRFFSNFQYSDIHNMMRNTQVHELVSSNSLEAGPGHPERSNYDNVYEYAGPSPHLASRIGDTLLTYDLNGNTVAECRSVNGSVCANMENGPATHNHYRRYVWTEENTLRAVIHGGGDVTRFFYGVDGERVAKLGRGGTSLTIGQFFSIKGRQHGTKHIFAGSTRLASKLLPVPDADIGFEPPPSGGGSLPPDNGPPNDNGCDPSNYQPNKCPVVVTQPGNGQGQEPFVKPATYYYHPDHLGSTSWVTDQLARVHEHVEYFPYGEVWREQRYDDDGAPVREPHFLFSGKEFDEETGLGYFGARYYDPRKAQWLNPDPLLVGVIARGGSSEELARSQPLASEKIDESLTEASRRLAVFSFSRWNPLIYRDPDGKDFEILIGGPYKDHPYGHVAIRVFGNGYDVTYDFGRYGKTWGIGGSEGDGVLRVWSGSFKNYIAGEAATGRTTTGYVFKTTPKEDKAAMDYFAKLAAAAKSQSQDAKRGMSQYILKQDYDAVDNNCTTISIDGANAGNSSLGTKLKDPKESKGRGLTWLEKRAAGEVGDKIFMPADLQANMESDKGHYQKRTYNAASKSKD